MARAPKSCPPPSSSVESHPPSVERSSASPVTVVAVCGGHRCEALRRMRDDGALADLRQAARASRPAVLVTAQCLQRCADGPVVLAGQGYELQRCLQVVPRQVIAPATDRDLQALVGALGVEQDARPCGGTAAS